MSLFIIPNDKLYISQNPILFVAGELDSKYSKIGEELSSDKQLTITYKSISNAGHALLAENSMDVGQIVSEFLVSEVKKNMKDSKSIIKSKENS